MAESLHELTLVSHSEAETRALAFALSERLSAGDVVALSGPLGAGKTVLVRALTDALAVPASAGVCSPSYTLVNIYEGGRLPIAHLDLYRMADGDELEGIGFRDIIAGDHLVVIEWAERVSEALEVANLRIALHDEGVERRRICLSAEEASLLQGLDLPG